MARPKSEILSGYGKGFEVLKALANKVMDLGGSDVDNGRILKDKSLARKVAEPMVAQSGITVADGCELLTVNYAQVLIEAIAEGKFDWMNEDITSEHFPNATHETSEATLTVKLFHFGRDILSEAAINEMYKEGFRGATLRELLAYAVKNPDEQRKFPIVALGSFWRRLDDRNVSFLDIDGYGRGLHLEWWSVSWDGGCRFLAVRKS